MPEIKRIFHDKYQDYKISPRAEYKFERVVARPDVYSADCLFTRFRKSGERCDEFVFFDVDQEKTGIYLIERKQHSENITKVKQQLQGGANFIQDFLTDDAATDQQPFDFMPVWVSRGIKPTIRHKLREHKISLRSTSKYIRHSKINTPLPPLR